MIRLAAIFSGFLVCGVAALAQVDHAHGSSDPIRIEVAPERLAECRLTLAQVGLLPVATDSAPVEHSDLPAVVCVAIKA